MTEHLTGPSETPVVPGEPPLTSADDLDLIQRYCAGVLHGAEREQFEARLIAEPVLRSELDLSDAMKGGLTHLHGRGEIGSLIEAQPQRWPWRPLAIAASVAAGMLGIVSITLVQRLDSERQASADFARQLARASAAPVATTVVLRLAQLRSGGAEPDLIWSQTAVPTLVELRMDLGTATSGRYTVRLARVDAERAIPLLQLPNVAASRHGEIALSVHSSLLSPATYRIDAAPESPDDVADLAHSYVLRVTR